MLSRTMLLCVTFLQIVSFATADDVLQADVTTQHFETHIRPVLATSCIQCHGEEKQEGDLRLDSLAAFLQGGESGPAIVPGDAENSLLLSALRYEELEMPPTEQLDDERIAQFARWIQEGAVWPENVEQIRGTRNEISDDDRSWWAFQPLKETSPPAETVDDPTQNEIDRFVHSKLAEHDMRPTSLADKSTLARRLYLNVLGLPPTPEQLQTFVENEASNAYEQLVDSLLADKRHGEHWARFWLDLVRYAESDGWNADAYRADIWRYREYVVDSFNNDKPWPQFVREQLAGDELERPTPEALAATGYLRLGIYEYNQRNARQHWDDILNEITDVTGDVFLGMGMACARCHDHKFDPILQVDYYKLRAFFEPIIFTDETHYADNPGVAAYNVQLAVWEAQTKTIRDEIDVLQKPYHDRKWHATVDKFPLEIQASFAKPMKLRNSWDQQMAYLVGRQFYEEGGGPLQDITDQDKQRLDSLKSQLAEFDDVKPAALSTLMSVHNFPGEYAATSIPGRETLGDVQPGFMRVMSTSKETEFPQTQRQRRSTLADWITSPDNPLTSRVIVNRIWKQHFGRGLVRTVNDFGTLGGQPTHPELLDWLTQEFIADGWSLKRLHKRILMSATWRQASAHPLQADYDVRDPENTLLWRRDVKRLSAEQIRDSMLVASGELAPEIGGPSVDGTELRRALYVKSVRNRPDTFLQTFDVANGLRSVGQRNSTTTPTQALMMINGDFTLERSRSWAKRLGQLPDDETRIRHAIQSTWGRSPTDDELAASRDFISSRSTEDEFEKLVDFCHVLLNSNEFLYVD